MSTGGLNQGDVSPCTVLSISQQGDSGVMRYLASRLRACWQSVPFNQSAQQTVWQPNSLIYKWYLFRESGHQNGFLPNGPFPKWSPPKFSTTTKFPFTFHNSAPFSSDKIRAKILDLGYGGDEKENEFHVTKNSKTNCVRGGLSSSALGKPAAADLRLGLATAPVLYASTEFPELETMIAR